MSSIRQHIHGTLDSLPFGAFAVALSFGLVLFMTTGGWIW
jgi:hypothetical protein